MDEQAFAEYLDFLVQTKGSQTSAAQAWGVSKQYLSDILQGRRLPGPKLLKALGVRREVVYTEEAVLREVPQEDGHH
jgi:transcriptional regulator with XRE-family HTH domain